MNEKEYSPLMEIKNKLMKLEYALMEEQYHYDSIPKRKAFTASKLKIKCFVLFPFLLGFILFLLFMKKTFKEIPTDPRLRLLWVSMLYILIVLAIIIVFLLIGIRKDAGLLIGVSNKHAMSGAPNYKEEERRARNRIIVLQDEILSVKEEIKAYKERRSYEEVRKEKENKEFYEKDPLEMDDDEFFYYALGTWAESKETVIIKYKNGVYEDEKEKLEKEISSYNKIVEQIEKSRVDIDLEYQKSEEIFIYYVLVFFVLLIIQGAFGENMIALFVTAGLAVVNMIFMMRFFFKRYKQASIYYKVEHKYDKVKYMAEEKRIIPTKLQKQEIYYQIKLCKRKLAYVEQVIEKLGTMKL